MKSYTDLEQSKKLAEILPVESADGFYEAQHNPLTDKWEYILFTGNKWASEEVVIPCWSLAALLDVYPVAVGKDLDMYCCWQNSKNLCSEHYDNPVDACVEVVLKLKENNLL